MSRTFLDVLTLTAVWLCWCHGSGLALNIDIAPNEVNGLVHDNVKIRCELDQTDTDVKEIMLLEISKEDAPIAILRQNTQVSVGKGTHSKVQVNGNISKPIEGSFIEVTLTNPEVKDGGSYTCLVYFLDGISLLKEMRTSASLKVSSFEFNMRIHPSKTNSYVPRVNMSCELKNINADVKKIVMLQLQKENIPIVVLRPDTKMSFGTDFDPNFQAVGSIDPASNESYIRLAVSRPRLEDSGSYMCVLFYLDKENVLREKSKSSNLTVANDDIEATVNYLVQELERHRKEALARDMQLQNHITTLEAHNTELQSKMTSVKANDIELQNKMTSLTDNNAELQSQMTSLKANNTEFQSQMTSLKANNTDLQSQMTSVKAITPEFQRQMTSLTANNTGLQIQITALEARDAQVRSQIRELIANDSALQSQGTHRNGLENTTVNFMAVYANGATLSAGQVFVYGDVVVNEGGGYNKNTGIFTAPVSGYYLLHMSVFIRQHLYIYLDLKTGSGGQVFRLFAGDQNSWEDYSDGSCVHRMEAGNQVKPVVFASNGAILSADSADNRMGKFYGFLLKAL